MIADIIAGLRGDPDFAGQVHCRPEDAGDVPQLGVADLWLQ